MPMSTHDARQRGDIMLSALGSHLQTLGGLLAAHAEIKHDTSPNFKWKLEQQIIALSVRSCFDSPTSQGYVVPGASVKIPPGDCTVGIATVRTREPCYSSCTEIPPSSAFSNKVSEMRDVLAMEECTAVVEDPMKRLSKNSDASAVVLKQRGKSVKMQAIESLPKDGSDTARKSDRRASERRASDRRTLGKSRTLEGTAKDIVTKDVVKKRSQYRKDLLESEKKDHHTDHAQLRKSAVDFLVAGVIMFNAFVIGLSADLEKDWKGWEAFEYFFTFFFAGEMFCKLYFLGCKQYFTGPDWGWNNFDGVVVVIALLDFTAGLVFAMAGSGSGINLKEVKTVKMIRLCRLARLVRLLRFKFFAELKAMIMGVFAGLRVLGWAIVLFFMFLFLLAVVLRGLIGEEEGYPKATFGSVPWAMFTLFQCYTDGCAAHDGTPLQAHLYKLYGAQFMLPYMLLYLFVTIGLFNLIMAIFVDNVQENTRTRRQQERVEDGSRLEVQLRTLVKRLYAHHVLGIERNADSGGWKKFSSDSKAQEVEEFISEMDHDAIKISRDAFEFIVNDSSMFTMLEALEISQSHGVALFDVLDADMSGELEYEELVTGLMNLRGPAEKSDAVAALLCIRVVQQLLKEFLEEQRQSIRLSAHANPWSSEVG